MSEEAWINAVSLLYGARVPDRTFDQLAATLPWAGSVVLAAHPQRTSAVLRRAYRKQAPSSIRKALLWIAPMSSTDLRAVIDVEARLGDLTADALALHAPALTDADFSHVWSTVATALGTDAAEDASVSRPEREQALAALLGAGSVYPTIRDYYPRLLAKKHEHALWRLDRPRLVSGDDDGGRSRWVETRLDPTVRLSQLPEDMVRVAGAWVADRVGVEPAAWQLIASMASSDPSLVEVVDTVAGVFEPVVATTPSVVRSRRRPYRWARLLRRSTR